MLVIVSSELSVDLVAADILPDVVLAGLHRVVDGKRFAIVDNGHASALNLSVCALGVNGDEKRGEAK